MKSILLLMFATLAQSAFATGGFYCSYKDETGTSFVVSAVTSRSFQSGIVSLDAALTVDVPAQNRTNTIETNFTREDVRQYWNNDGDFRLNLYSETLEGDHKYSRVRIVTKENGDYEYVGTISIDGTGYEEKNLPITCSVE